MTKHPRLTAGEPEQAFQDLVNFGKSVYEVPIHKQYDIAIGVLVFRRMQTSIRLAGHHLTFSLHQHLSLNLVVT